MRNEQMESIDLYIDTLAKNSLLCLLKRHYRELIEYIQFCC